MTTVGILIGVVFTIAAITELMIVGATSGGWRVVHVILGIVFVLGAIWGYTNPKDAFWALASMLGFVLVIYGTVELVEAVATRDVNPLWWLGLIAGVLMTGLAFWTSGQFFIHKAYVLLVFAGIWALMHGITDIARAFAVRSLRD